MNTMKTEQLLENCIDAQNQAFTNCLETSRKVQEAALGDGSLEKGTDIYKEFINGQMKVLKDLEEKTVETEGESDEKNQPIASLFEQAVNFQKKNLEAIKDLQEKFLEPFGHQDKDLFNTKEGLNQLQKTQEETLSLFREWMRNWGAMTGEVKKTTPASSQAEEEDLRTELKALNERLASLEKQVSPSTAKK